LFTSRESPRIPVHPAQHSGVTLVPAGEDKYLIGRKYLQEVNGIFETTSRKEPSEKECGRGQRGRYLRGKVEASKEVLRAMVPDRQKA